MDCRQITEKLRKEQDAQMEELRYLLEHLDEESSAYLRAAAAEEAVRHFGRKIYLRSSSPTTAKMTVSTAVSAGAIRMQCVTV